jgi:hypothetical protein
MALHDATRARCENVPSTRPMRQRTTMMVSADRQAKKAHVARLCRRHVTPQLGNHKTTEVPSPQCPHPKLKANPNQPSPAPFSLSHGSSDSRSFSPCSGGS